jgi:hypothetical protein
MRNWNDGSISQVSSKSSSQMLNKAEQPQMASNPPKSSHPDLDLSEAKYQEKNKDVSGSSSTDPPTLQVAGPLPFNPAATKKLLRKLDLNLIPFLALLYM